jgi:hypothetical protein
MSYFLANLIGFFIVCVVAGFWRSQIEKEERRKYEEKEESLKVEIEKYKARDVRDMSVAELERELKERKYAQAMKEKYEADRQQAYRDNPLKYQAMF